jgi:Tol biopolymer transport system component
MIDERHVRDMLERRAGTISATPADEPKAIRRARRRLALNATVVGLVGLAVVAGALAGLRTIQATPTPVKPATPPPSLAGMGSLAYVVDGDIYVADGDGSNPVRIVDGRPPNECSGHPENWAEGPIWSPDGRYLAYRHADCATDDWHGGVAISDPEGNPITSFSTGTGWEISWSPDSTRVAVWVSFGETIGVFGLDGERQALLAMPAGWSPAGDHDPKWLPDGRSLLVQNEMVVPVDGSGPYRLPWAGRRTTGVTYSPDGSRVAYVDGRSLVVAEADGSNPQVVFDDEAWSPVWSPTGDRIAFTSSEGRINQIRVLDLATGTATLLAEADGSDQLEVIDFSPEGDRIHFSRMNWSIDAFSLWSVNADGSDLRRLVTGTPWGDWLSSGPTP